MCMYVRVWIFSLYLFVVARCGGEDREVLYVAEVNAPTQTLVDVAAKGGNVEDDDDLVSPPALQLRLEGEAADTEQKEIDDDEEVREKTREGTVTPV